MTCSDIWIIDTLYIPDVQQICGRNMLETAEMVGSGHPLDCSGGKLCEAWMFGGWGWGKPNPNKGRFLPFTMPWKYGWKMACRTVFTFSRVLFCFQKRSNLASKLLRSNTQMILFECDTLPKWQMASRACWHLGKDKTHVVSFFPFRQKISHGLGYVRIPESSLFVFLAGVF